MASSKLEEGAAKYPRTPHLPFSPGVGVDDVVAELLPRLLQGEVVITEKLDGGNCSFYQGKVFSRSAADETSHASFGPVKQLFARLAPMLQRSEVQLFGENMFGIHSIEYDYLQSCFYLFAARDVKTNRWLAWDEVTDLADQLGLLSVPVLCRRHFGSLDELQNVMEKAMLVKSQCSLGSVRPEGFVVRTVDGFHSSDFEQLTAKFVRQGHIQTDATWRRTWRKAKIHG